MLNQAFHAVNVQRADIDTRVNSVIALLRAFEAADPRVALPQESTLPAQHIIQSYHKRLKIGEIAGAVVDGEEQQMIDDLIRNGKIMPSPYQPRPSRPPPSHHQRSQSPPQIVGGQFRPPPNVLPIPVPVPVPSLPLPQKIVQLPLPQRVPQYPQPVKIAAPSSLPLPERVFPAANVVPAQPKAVVVPQAAAHIGDFPYRQPVKKQQVQPQQLQPQQHPRPPKHSTNPPHPQQHQNRPKKPKITPSPRGHPKDLPLPARIDAAEELSGGEDAVDEDGFPIYDPNSFGPDVEILSHEEWDLLAVKEEGGYVSPHQPSPPPHEEEPLPQPQYVPPPWERPRTSWHDEAPYGQQPAPPPHVQPQAPLFLDADDDTVLRSRVYEELPPDAGEALSLPDLCRICDTRKVDCILEPCGEALYCFICATQAKMRGGGKCPSCGAAIEFVDSFS